MAEQERRLRDMTDEMESYKKQQEELEEQRRAAEELRLQYEESAHMAQEEKDRLVCILTNDGIFFFVENIIHIDEMISPMIVRNLLNSNSKCKRFTSSFCLKFRAFYFYQILNAFNKLKIMPTNAY